MAKAYIYILKDDAGNAPFYVGSTLYPEKRKQDHLTAVRLGNNSNKHFCNKVRKVGLDSVVLEVIEETDDVSRWDRESAWIQHYVDAGISLTNRYHNGFEYEVICDKRDEYDSTELTPEKWMIAESIRENRSQTDDGIVQALEDAIVAIMETIERKYPSEIAALLGNGEVH